MSETDATLSETKTNVENLREGFITFSAMNSKPTVAVSFIVQFQDAITI